MKVHDPAVKDLPESWNNRVQRVAEPQEALDGVSALVVATEWPHYKKVSFEQVPGLLPGLVIIDANRFVPHLKEVVNARYVAVGSPTVRG